MIDGLVAGGRQTTNKLRRERFTIHQSVLRIAPPVGSALERMPSQPVNSVPHLTVRRPSNTARAFTSRAYYRIVTDGVGIPIIESPCEMCLVTDICGRSKCDKFAATIPSLIPPAILCRPFCFCG